MRLRPMDVFPDAESRESLGRRHEASQSQSHHQYDSSRYGAGPRNYEPRQTCAETEANGKTITGFQAALAHSLRRSVKGLPSRRRNDLPQFVL